MFTELPISLESIAAVFDHSTDCVKVISADGKLLWINRGGLCAMEIESFDLVRGGDWPSFWPVETQPEIRATLRHSPPVASHLTAFCPTARGTPKWWEVTVVPITTVDGTHGGFIATSRDVTERETAARTREVLLQEMRHRQGNILALAGTLMQVHALGRPELSDFVQEMSNRLAALGRAQNVVARPDRAEIADEAVDVEGLLRTLVRPLVGPGCELVIDCAPHLMLPADKVDVVGVVLSELAVNAGKHGAFRHGGQVRLTAEPWADGLRITWDEISNRPVRNRARQGGQGLALMGRIARINDAIFEIDWQPDGQCARLVLRHESRSVCATAA